MQVREFSSRNFVRPRGERVVELRAAHGWTQERLAEKAILSVRTIQNIERGRPTQFSTLIRLARALDIEPKECITEHPEPAASADPMADPVSTVSPSAPLPECPYRGLLPFREQDAHLLFGRERLAGLLREKLSHKGIIQVSGASGSGKSSLVVAGLIPALRKTGSGQILYCRPGTDPFGSLAGVLMPMLEPELDEISRAARVPMLSGVLQDGQLPYLLRRLRAPKDGLLVFVDQFEELYTLVASHELRHRFLDCLLAFTHTGNESGGIGTRVVYTIRADFASRLLLHREFIDAIQDADVKIGPMTREESESAIRDPALLRGVRFEPGLVERIVNDAGREPGALPLLEFALTELWERQSGGILTHAAYEDTGRLSGAIAKRAETLFRSLSPAEQDVARRILTRLVRLAEDGGDDSRQRATLASLCGHAEPDFDAGRKVLDLLTVARLITVGSGDDVRHGEVAEIAHEALIRSWPRFGQWLQEDRDILVWRQRTRTLVNHWQGAARDTAMLLRGPLLDEAKLWISRRSKELSAPEREFIDASVAIDRKERANRPAATVELLVDGSDLDLTGLGRSHPASGGDRAGKLFRLQINVIPVPDTQRGVLRSRLPELQTTEVLRLLAAGVSRSPESVVQPECGREPEQPAQLDEQTLTLVQRLQARGATGLALEMLTPQLDGIRDSALRLKFASIVFDMMHVRGRYADAAALIEQELALYPEPEHVHSALLLPLKVRLLHHQMFFRPVTELWREMLDLLAQCDPHENPATHGEILFMLGGNLGTLRGDYRTAREFLVRALRNARARQDEYLLARCLRKYGDFLRHGGRLRAAHAALTAAIARSETGRGSRQRVYGLGCLGDLERQRGNFRAAAERFEEAITLARELYIPGWLGNLHLGLAELAMARGVFDDARGLLSQAEAHYRSTGPKHWWGDVQVGLCRCRLMRASGDGGWVKCARDVQNDAIAAGYQRDAAFAARLLEGGDRIDNVLMFL